LITLFIHHLTTYRYKRRLEFGPHRLILRPRESRSLRLKSHELLCKPAANVTWSHDVFGNSVATATFSEASETLEIESFAELTLHVDPWPVFEISASAASYPFLLSEDEMTDLGALRLQSYLDASGRLHDWARSFVAARPTDTLSLLKDICAGIATQIDYQVREEEYTQSPEQTLACGRGSCRDFAALFVDAVRSLGFGARIVSGYLYDADASLVGSSGSGSTHAWAEVYVPGAGWITFDPTNRSIGDANLVPVAVARHILQTVPVAGSYVGARDFFDQLEVRVAVKRSAS
jgi:transglutaminase-like putative cysteine protease